MRIFLDANVLFSASNPSSNIAQLIYLFLERHEIVTSDLALGEARRNIQAKRPQWRDAFIQLSKKVTVVPTRIMKLPVPIADKDAPILASAIQSQCNYFVTGDKKHFGLLFDQEVEGLVVVYLGRMAEIVFDFE
jgi:predicted nucleic acid-binding protein